jgi:UDP-glucose 4-epimerase
MKTILGGAINSRKIAEKYFFEAACYVSSDKACSPVTYYGQLKAAAENAFTYPSKRKNTNKNFVNLSACRYGNVVSSTGSIFCLMNEAVKKNYPLTLFSTEMTRFYMDVEQSVDLILRALRHSNEIIVPYLKSYLIKDSFELYAEKFGLKYRIGFPRPNEKIHEVMISNEELPRTKEQFDFSALVPSYFRITPFVQEQIVTFDSEYSSKNVVISKEALNKYLEAKNWFNISI